MDEFLILLQAKLDEAKSKGNVNADINELQNQLDKLKVQVEINPKSISNITQQMSKLGIQIGQDFGKAFNNGLQSTINTNVLNQINKISDSSTSTIVQNEKKKQESYKATSDAVVYHAGVISKLNKAETNGRFYGSSRGTGYFGTGHYFVDSKTKHELDNNSSYSKLPYTSVDISKYDNLFKATTDEIAGKLHSFLENLTRFTQGNDRFNIDELFSQFKNVFTDTTMDIKDFGDKMEQLKSFMSNSNLSDRSDSVSTQFMKSLGYGGVDTRGTKYADTRYGTVIYDLKEESVLQANITDELQKQGQMLEKINYEKGQVFDSSADAKIQEQIDAQRRLAEVQAEFKRSFNTSNLDKTDSELTSARNRLSEINDIISNCQRSIKNATVESQEFAREMKSLGLNMTDREIEEHAKESAVSYQKRIEELSLERSELEKRIPVLEENYNKESQLASEAYKQAQQIVEQRRLEAQQSSTTASEVIQNEEKKQQAIQETIQLKSKLTDFSSEKISNGIEAVNDNGIINLEKSADKIRETYSELGKVTTQTVANLDNGISQIKVKVESTDGELKRAYSFLMDLSEDGKSFVFNDESLKYSENVVRKLNEQKDATNQITQAEEKLANEMADVREKSEQARQAEQKRQELAQNKVINKSLEDEYKQKQKLADKVHEIQLSMDNGYGASEYQNRINAVTASLEKYGVETQEAKNITASLQSTFDSMKGMSGQELVNQADKLEQEFKAVKASVEQAKIAYDKYMQPVSNEKATSLINRINTFLSKNTRITNDAKIALQGYADELGRGVSLSRWNEINGKLKETENSMRGLHRLGASLKDQMSQAAQSFTQWLSVSSVVMLLVSKIKNAITELKEVNSIMTEITKTADQLSKADLSKVENTSYKTASKYGKKASNYLTGIQEMYRAGYENAEDLAELSTLAQAAGDMQDDLANDYLIATDAAYKLKGNTEALNDVLDGQNYITNRNALSMQDLAEATKIAASQSASSGIAIDQATAAMGTMIATTRQGGDVAARAWKGILMNIQQVEGEVEDGEIIDAESLSKYEKACESLGVSLKEVKDGVISLRDPMQILKELSEAYTALDESDARRANLISAVGGKYRGNQLNALLENWSLYEKMLKDYAEGSGSALEEAMKSANNWEGSMNRLGNTFTKVVNNIVRSDAVITGANGLNSLLSIIDKITSKLGSLGTIGTISGGIAGAKGQG